MHIDYNRISARLLMQFLQYSINQVSWVARSALGWLRQIASIICFLGFSGTGHTEETGPKDGEVADGILPSLSTLWLVPESLRLRYPDQFEMSDPPAIYSRKFPLFAQEAINRGYLLPKPYGLSIIGANNVQEQFITDMSVALGKGTVISPT